MSNGSTFSTAKPRKPCNDIYQLNKVRVSGNYWINTTTGVHQVCCDNYGIRMWWPQGTIANLNTNRGDNSPSGWTKITTPVAVCIASSAKAGCYSTEFPTLSTPYMRSKVCGMACRRLQACRVLLVLVLLFPLLNQSMVNM